MAKITPTIRQEKLARNLVTNLKERRWDTLKDLLIDSGYSKLVASQSAKTIIQNKGVQESLAKLGFNGTAAKAVVSEILLTGDEGNRLKAADMIFKVQGTYAPDKSVVLHGDIVKLIEKLEQENE